MLVIFKNYFDLASIITNKNKAISKTTKSQGKIWQSFSNLVFGKLFVANFLLRTIVVILINIVKKTIQAIDKIKTGIKPSATPSMAVDSGLKTPIIISTPR